MMLQSSPMYGLPWDGSAICLSGGGHDSIVVLMRDSGRMHVCVCVCVCSSVYPPSNNCNYQYKVATRVAGELQDAAHQPAGRAHYLDFIYPISKKPILERWLKLGRKGKG